MGKNTLSVFIAIAAIFFSPHNSYSQTITTVVGCGIGNDSLATNAEVLAPNKVAFDTSGNMFIADLDNNVVREVTPTGIISTFAGNGLYQCSGDGGPATAASFGYVNGVATDRNGNVFVVDIQCSCIRKVNSSGIITTIAGTGTAGYTGDGISAVTAELNYPSDVVTDTTGNIYIDDYYNYRIRKVDASGIITTVAGNGAAAAPTFGGPATASSIGCPFKIAVDNYGNLFIGSYADWYVMKVDTAGNIWNVAGVGTYGFSGDGGPATTAQFSAPCGLAVDSAGNIYISDIDHARIRMVNAATGLISTLAGDGTTGYSGDSGPATTAEINEPEGLTIGPSNVLYLADILNNRIRAINPAGIITTAAGKNTLFGEGYPGVNSMLGDPQDVVTDAAGNVYIADAYNSRVRMLSASSGTLSTVAGDGVRDDESGYTGDGGPATMANIARPSALTFDAAGNLYICDESLQRVRKVNTSGIISTIAGNGIMGYGGSGIPATAAEVAYPLGIAVDRSGNVYVSDNNNQRIRKIDASGIITTVAGNGAAGYRGDGRRAVEAEISYPVGVAVDSIGDVYIADQGNNCIRMVDTTGIISTIAGTGGVQGYGGDGGPAVDALLGWPQELRIDNAGDILFADAYDNVVRVITPDGTISTIAGNGTAGFRGDGGSALSAELSGPAAAAVDGSGNVYIADAGNDRVRKVNIAYLGVHNNKLASQAAVIYPNPTNGVFNIENGAGSTYIISDITGNEIRKGVVVNANMSIDIGGFSSGTYLLQLIGSSGASQTIKVTKE